MIPNIPFRLAKGHSKDPATGACVNAAIAWIEHGMHTDHPPCVAPIITQFTIGPNDAMDDKTRQRFVPFMARMAGSYSPEHDNARRRIMVLAATRVFLPLAMEAAKFDDEAAKLRALPDYASNSDLANAANAAFAAAEAAADAVAANAAANASYSAADVANAAGAAAYVAGAAASNAACAVVWDAYFIVLNDVLNAGPQGSAWDADQIKTGAAAFKRAGGVLVPA